MSTTHPTKPPTPTARGLQHTPGQPGGRVLRDPRSHRTYRDAATRYITNAPTIVTCALCHHPVDTRLPRTTPAGPTIEHTLPIRRILTMAHSQAHALQLACDQTYWAIAHRRCQDAQGGATTAERHAPRPEHTIDWT